MPAKSLSHLRKEPVTLASIGCVLVSLVAGEFLIAASVAVALLLVRRRTTTIEDIRNARKRIGGTHHVHEWSPVEVNYPASYGIDARTETVAYCSNGNCTEILTHEEYALFRQSQMGHGRGVRSWTRSATLGTYTPFCSRCAASTEIGDIVHAVDDGVICDPCDKKGADTHTGASKHLVRESVGEGDRISLVGGGCVVTVKGDVRGWVKVSGGSARVEIGGNVWPGARVYAIGGSAKIIVRGRIVAGSDVRVDGGGAKIIQDRRARDERVSG